MTLLPERLPKPTPVQADTKRQRCRQAITTTIYVVLIFALLPTLSWGAKNLITGEEPLSAQEAFAPSVSHVSQDALTVNFTIAEGYYLYRDKTHFAADEITLASPVFPPAIVTNDEFFGEQAIFRQSALIKLPYSRTSANQKITVTVKFQGCADMGLCYPPTSVPLSIELPAMATENTSREILPTSNVNSIEKLFSNTSAQNELLPPDLAYLPLIMQANDKQITVRWQIEPGYYLYRDKLSFSLIDAGGAHLLNADLDPGIEQHDEFFGNVRIFRESAEARLTLESTTNLAQSSNAQLQINYQGCADIGVCFPPSTTTLPIAFDSSPSANEPTALNITDPAQTATLATQSVNATRVGAAPATSDSTAQSEQDRLFDFLGNNSLWLNIVTFFGLGLLLAFTPCVLPMVPILSSLIVGQGNEMSTGKAFRLSLVYVLVMASTYAIVGIIVGLSGYNVQAFLQNPWVLSAIAVLFVVLSLSMFGFYELQMPAKLQNKLTQWSNRQGSGEVTGVAAMGFISTLIVGPCVTAPLAGALIYIAKTGDALIGGVALFSLGLGMGAPLLLIGTSAGKLLPRTGTWMNATKHIFGLMLLAMAIYMVSRFLPAGVSMGLYGILAIMSGIHFGATDALNRDSTGWQRFSKGLGLIITVYGLALLLGALAGGSSLSTPLSGIMASSSGANTTDSKQHGIVFQRVKSVDDLQRAVSEAQQQSRPVMLDFYADWCISCKEMEAFTFTDPRVQALLSNAVLIQADVTANDDADQALLKQFDLFGPPGIIFYSQQGTELPAARVVGFMNADKFSNHVEQFLDNTSR